MSIKSRLQRLERSLGPAAPNGQRPPSARPNRSNAEPGLSRGRGVLSGTRLCGEHGRRVGRVPEACGETKNTPSWPRRWRRPIRGRHCWPSWIKRWPWWSKRSVFDYPTAPVD